MADVTLKDGAGADFIYANNSNGRAAATASRPVVLSTEDKASLDAITTALADNATGADIASVVTALGTLPTGAATSAKQDTLIGHVDGIETLLGGTLNVAGTFFQATQPVSIAAPVAVTGTFWQATQPVSLASLPALAAGTNNIGDVDVLTLPALAAGSAIIGKVGIDQTTDGTTNKVNIDASLKSGTATRTTVSSSTASATILASNANRKGATIFNSDANALLLDLSGGTAAATRCQVRLTQYQSYEVGSGFTGAITGIWEADGAGQADIVEFT